MSHEITIRRDGSAEAFYHKEPAWHGHGQVVEDAPNSEEAIKLAQLDWTVSKQPIFTLNKENQRVNITSDMATIRDDNNVVLGVVGSKYTVIQNSQAFKFVDGLIETGEIKYEAAGSLKEGKIIWLLAKMPEEYFVSEDDPLLNYILLTTGHDGYHTLKVLPTSIRVVCNNTLQMALAHKTQKFVQVRHSLNAMDKIEYARKLLFGVKAQTDAYNAIQSKLAAISMTAEKVMEFIEKMFPMPADKEESTKTLNIRNRVLENYEFDEEQMTKAAKGTAFGLFNAVTKWVDHQRGEKDPDKQFASAWFGSGSQIKLRALHILQEQLGIN